MEELLPSKAYYSKPIAGLKTSGKSIPGLTQKL